MQDDIPGNLTRENLKTLARLCREYRKQRGLTQEAAAAACGFYPHIWNRVENKHPGTLSLRRLRIIVNLVLKLSPTPIKKDYHYGEDGRRKRQDRGPVQAQESTGAGTGAAAR